jgi:hypothetical protein
MISSKITNIPTIEIDDTLMEKIYTQTELDGKFVVPVMKEYILIIIDRDKMRNIMRQTLMKDPIFPILTKQERQEYVEFNLKMTSIDPDARELLHIKHTTDKSFRLLYFDCVAKAKMLSMNCQYEDDIGRYSYYLRRISNAMSNDDIQKMGQFVLRQTLCVSYYLSHQSDYPEYEVIQYKNRARIQLKGGMLLYNK